MRRCQRQTSSCQLHHRLQQQGGLLRRRLLLYLLPGRCCLPARLLLCLLLTGQPLLGHRLNVAVLGMVSLDSMMCFGQPHHAGTITSCGMRAAALVLQVGHLHTEEPSSLLATPEPGHTVWDGVVVSKRIVSCPIAMVAHRPGVSSTSAAGIPESTSASLRCDCDVLVFGPGSQHRREACSACVTHHCSCRRAAVV